MRTHQWRTLALAAMLGMGVAGAQAALQGRDLDGNAATFEAYYDTTQNISWLADANAGGGAYFWDGATAWAAQLNVGGVTGWRLPVTPAVDPSCQFDAYGFGCSASEMGHLYEVDHISFLSPGPFSGLVGTGNWSASAGPVAFSRFAYGFNGGYTGFMLAHQNFGNTADAWAVHDGDVGNAVAAVPEPGTYAMMLGGLLALGTVARHRKPR